MASVHRDLHEQVGLLHSSRPSAAEQALLMQGGRSSPQPTHAQTCRGTHKYIRNITCKPTPTNRPLQLLYRALAANEEVVQELLKQAEAIARNQFGMAKADFSSKVRLLQNHLSRSSLP